ncbi:MAG: hypothetical protein HUK22_08880, partial [Thermoguttaceae bacterium]|nr:hypothetical protein [Thermoguttaceae bacterium]
METEKTRRRPRFLIAILALSVVAAVVVKISRDAGAFGSDSNLKANIKKVEKLRAVVARRILVCNEPFDSRDGEFVKLAADLAKIRRQPEACGIDQTRLDLATQILGGEIDAQTKTGAATLDKFLADYQYCAQNAEFLLDLCYHYNDMNDKIRAANSAAERAKIKAELGEDYQAALDLLGAYADVCNELDAGDLRPKAASENGAIGKIFAKIPTPELETRAP